jgi:hypothetical protein
MHRAADVCSTRVRMEVGRVAAVEGPGPWSGPLKINWGLCPQTTGILRLIARIPWGSGHERRSRPLNPGRWVGAQVAFPQSPILRPGTIKHIKPINK